MPTATLSSAEEQLARFGLTEADVEHLVKALAQGNKHTRHVVRGALRELGGAAVPALERLAARGDLRVRHEVDELLQEIRGKQR